MKRIISYLISLLPNSNRYKQTFYSKHYTQGLSHHCTSCYWRHRLCSYSPPNSKIVNNRIIWDDCPHWKSGGCYSCEVYRISELTDDDDLWFSNNCEAECMGGCSKWTLRKDFREGKYNEANS